MAPRTIQISSYVLGQAHYDVTAALHGVCKSTQGEILERFRLTRDVATWQGRRETPPANQIITAADDLLLLGNVADDPTASCTQRSVWFELTTGKRLHVSSICRALYRLECSYQKVRASA